MITRRCRVCKKPPRPWLESPFGRAWQAAARSNFAGSTVGRAGLDGGGANEGFVAAPQASGIAADGQFVYWADNATGTIGRANLNGTTPNQTFITGLGAPNGVDVDSGHLYWADFGNGSIGRANLDGSAWAPAFIAGANGPNGITVDGGAFPPATTLTLAPGAPNGAGGWYTTGVHVTAAASDNVYPVASLRCVSDPPGPPATFAAIAPACSLAGAGVDVSAKARTPPTPPPRIRRATGTPVSAAFRIDTARPTVRAHALSPTPSMTWYFALADHGTATTVSSMKIASVPTKAALKLVCTGQGCPSKTNSAAAVKPAKCKGKKCRARSRDVDLTGLFRGHRLTAGSRITVTVTQRNTNGKAFVFAIRKGKLPKPQVGCLTPGSSKLNRGC